MFLILFMTFPLFVQAQRNEAFRESIHTMQVLVNGEWNRTPLLELGSSDVLHISFDDLTHEYRRYRYRVEHCDFNWQPTTGLFPSDFLRGETSDQPIDDYQESLNTSVLYTHYSFTFPNSRVGVTKSGNYPLTTMRKKTFVYSVLVWLKTKWLYRQWRQQRPILIGIKTISR